MVSLWWTRACSVCVENCVFPSLRGFNFKSLLESLRIWKTVICDPVSQGKGFCFFFKYSSQENIVRALKGETPSVLSQWLYPTTLCSLVCSVCHCYFFRINTALLQWFLFSFLFHETGCLCVPNTQRSSCLCQSPFSDG